MDPDSRMENAATSAARWPSEPAFPTPLWTAHDAAHKAPQAYSSSASQTPESQMHHDRRHARMTRD